MGFPIATLETQSRNLGQSYSAPPPPPLPLVALVGPAADLAPDTAAAVTVPFSVSRTGDLARVGTVDWAIVPGGAPIPAAAFQGGAYPSGTVLFDLGVSGVPASFVLAPQALPFADQFADLALSNPVGCRPGSPASVTLRLPGQTVPTQDVVSVAVSDTSWQVDQSTSEHVATVSRTNAGGVYLAGTAVNLALAGTGANPLVAGDILGGLTNQAVSFGAGVTGVDVVIATLPTPTSPNPDKTGRLSLSGPVSARLHPTDATVDVTLTKPDDGVGPPPPPPGILPPQYTDPNLVGMTAQGSACATWADLDAAARAISNTDKCKTKFVQLAATFVDTGTRSLPYKGWTEGIGAAKRIYPLYIVGPAANIGDRAKIANLPHFIKFELSGASWVWLHGLAAEYPLQADAHNPYQPNHGPAIDLSGSTDCFVTRCWLDAPQGVFSNDGVRPRIGANDFYGTVHENNPDDWQTQCRFRQSGPSLARQARTIGALVYQNFHGHVRVPHEQLDNSGKYAPTPTAAFYTGDGVPPSTPMDVPYPANPYDLNCRDCWYFNNLIYAVHKYLIYSKAALNIWRNRCVSLDLWTEVDGPGVAHKGNAYHYIAVRGGNCTGKPLLPASSGYPQDISTVKYNSCEGKPGHCDQQAWNMQWEFNDFGGIPVNLFMHCDKDPKTLLAASKTRFRGNKNGKYQLCSARNDGGYSYFGPLIDVVWEYEGEGVAADAGTWNWEASNEPAGSVRSPNGTAVAWSAAGLNTETATIKFHASDSSHTACAAGQLTKQATTAAVRELKTAYYDSNYPAEFSKGRKGITTKDGMTWDNVGDGGQGG